MNRFLEALAKLFRIEELRKRVLFTLALLAVYRIGAHIPLPASTRRCWSSFFSRGRLGSRHLRSIQRRQFPPFDDFCPGHHALHHLVHHPAVDDRGVPVPRASAKRGRTRPPQNHPIHPLPDDRLSIIQGASIAASLQTPGSSGQALVYHPGWGFTLMTVLTLTTGSAFIMWLGEQISERGIGNGMSLIIFVGIVVGLPRAVFDLYEKAQDRRLGAVSPPLPFCS